MKGILEIIGGTILIAVGIPLSVLLLPLGYSIGVLLALIGAFMVLYGRRTVLRQQIRTHPSPTRDNG